jgi:hypothetical protein
MYTPEQFVYTDVPTEELGVSDVSTAPDPEHLFFEESTEGVIGLLPIEPGAFEIPEIFDAPQANYPIIVDADSAEQEWM